MYVCTYVCIYIYIYICFYRRASVEVGRDPVVVIGGSERQTHDGAVVGFLNSTNNNKMLYTGLLLVLVVVFVLVLVLLSSVVLVLLVLVGFLMWTKARLLRAKLRGWRNRVGKLIETSWLQRPITGLSLLVYA